MVVLRVLGGGVLHGAAWSGVERYLSGRVMMTDVALQQELQCFPLVTACSAPLHARHTLCHNLTTSVDRVETATSFSGTFTVGKK